MIKLEHLNIDEGLRYLGHKGNTLDEKTKELINICEAEVLAAAKPKYLYKAFDIAFTNKGVELLGSSVIFKGCDIKEHLKGCEKAVLMCATISSAVDLLIRRAQVIDMAKAVIINSLASVAIEQVCDKAEDIINDEFIEYNKTFRFSPGYGDLPIEVQSDILNTLNAQKLIGLCTGESSMLTPVKSVTAVIGLSHSKISRKSYGCAGCNNKADCPYRKAGTHCV